MGGYLAKAGEGRKGRSVTQRRKGAEGREGFTQRREGAEGREGFTQRRKGAKGRNRRVRRARRGGLRPAGVLSRPAFRGGYRGPPLPSTGSGCTFHGKKSRAPGGHPPPLAGDPWESWARCLSDGRRAHATAGDDRVLLILLFASSRRCERSPPSRMSR